MFAYHLYRSNIFFNMLCSQSVYTPIKYPRLKTISIKFQSSHFIATISCFNLHTKTQNFCQFHVFIKSILFFCQGRNVILVREIQSKWPFWLSFHNKKKQMKIETRGSPTSRFACYQGLCSGMYDESMSKATILPPNFFGFGPFGWRAVGARHGRTCFRLPRNSKASVSS